uniref:alpha/beta fold hydrolase n=1 Tax=Nonomuraea pusilla TaxID=46177 RepID=UPI0006E42F19|nr:alpha/beta hydrolase [Nonomuraea pusilla]
MTAFATTRDGRALHHAVTGAGDPLVVLESGLGMPGAGWALVAPSVARVTATLTYDRAGLGRSDPDRASRDHARMAADLLDLLDHVGAERCVLAGHSLGGAVVQLFALRHPERVAGLVLVDPSVPPQEVPLPRSPAYLLARLLQPVGDLAERAGDLARLALARLGVRRPSGFQREVAAYLPDDVRDATLAALAGPAAIAATRAESAAQQRSLRALHALRPAGALPPVPVTVITAGLRPPGFTRVWDGLRDSHRRLVAGRPLGRHVMAERSGHLVPQEQPDLVAVEILRVVEAVRRAG